MTIHKFKRRRKRGLKVEPGLSPLGTPLPSTRAEARHLGSDRYFTGKPCGRGHLSDRYTSSAECLECLNLRGPDPERVRQRAKIWYENNKERAILGSAQWNKENPVRRSEILTKWKESNVEARADWARKWRIENREKANSNARNWRNNNKEKRRQIAANWKEKNNESVKSYVHTRRARRRNSEGRYSAVDVKRIYKLQRGRCAYCRHRLNDIYEIDHIMPLSRGGTNWPDNLQLLCSPAGGNACNQSKSNKDPIDYARLLGRLL